MSGPTTTPVVEEAEPERWHAFMAGATVFTAVLGVLLMANDTSGAVGAILLGIAFIVLAVAGAAVTAFWTVYDGLWGWRRAVAVVACTPGAVVGVMVLWIMKTINLIAMSYLDRHPS